MIQPLFELSLSVVVSITGSGPQSSGSKPVLGPFSQQQLNCNLLPSSNTRSVTFPAQILDLIMSASCL